MSDKNSPDEGESSNATGSSSNGPSSTNDSRTGVNELTLEVPTWVEDALAAAGCDWRAAEPEWTPMETEGE